MSNQTINTPDFRRVAVIGAGGLGAVYATRLSTRPELEVVFLAEGERAERLARTGVVVNDLPSEVGVQRLETLEHPFDLVIVAVKHPQLREAVEQIAPAVGPDTMILSVLNGIDSEERLAERYGWERVLYGVALGIDALRTENRITYQSQGRLYVGRAQNEPPDSTVQAVAELLRGGGLTVEIPPDMLRVLWWKFMINVGINQTAAVLGLPFGPFRENAHAMRLMDTAMLEVVAAAKILKIELGPEDIEKWHEIMQGLAADGKPSMLQDVEARRKTEVEMLGGTVLRLSNELKTPAPLNAVLFDMLRARETAYGAGETAPELDFGGR